MIIFFYLVFEEIGIVKRIIKYWITFNDFHNYGGIQFLHFAITKLFYNN